MLIVCPKCGVRYIIPDNTSLKQIKKFMCSACAHTFDAVQSDNISASGLKELAQKVLSSQTAQTAAASAPELNQTQSQAQASADDVAPLSFVPESSLASIAALPEEFTPIVLNKKSKKRWIFWGVMVIAVCAVPVIGFIAQPIYRTVYQAVNRFASDMGQLPKAFLSATGASDINEFKALPTIQKEKAKQPVQPVQPVQSVDLNDSLQKATQALKIQSEDVLPQAVVSDTDKSAAVPVVDVKNQVKIRGASFRKELGFDGQEQIVVEGMIFNMSPKKVFVPHIQIQLSGADKTVVHTEQHALNPDVILPHHAISFKAVMPQKEQEIQDVHVDF